MGNIIFNQGKADIINGTINLETADTATTSTNALRIVLLSSNCTDTLNVTDTNCAAWSSFECGEPAYTYGAAAASTASGNRRPIFGCSIQGATTCVKSIVSGGTANNIMVDSPYDFVYSSSSNGQAFRYIGFMRLGTNQADSIGRPLMLIDLTTPQSMAGGSVTLQWNALGILNLA